MTAWHRYTRLGLTLLLAGGIIGMTAGTVSAACTERGEQDARRSGNVSTAQVGRNIDCESGSASSTTEQRWAAYCGPFGNWAPTNSVELIRGEEVAAGTPVDVGDVTQPVTGVGAATKSYRWAVQCSGPLGFSEYSIVLPVGEAPTDPVTVRNQALASLTIPDPQLGGSPPLDDPNRFSVVRIPTWLWITHPWQPLTASAADGGITVSVTATPTKVSWDPGDGEAAFDCLDAGEQWQPGKDESDITCGHTYLKSSAGQTNDAYQLTATVNWSLTWTINGVEQGQFDTYQPALTVSHQVGEIMSVSS